jgi:hypothetical protein
MGVRGGESGLSWSVWHGVRVPTQAPGAGTLGTGCGCQVGPRDLGQGTQLAPMPWQGCQNRSPGRRKSANLKGAPGLGRVPGWAWPRHLGSVLEASVRDPEECQECQLEPGIRKIAGPKSANSIAPGTQECQS